MVWLGRDHYRWRQRFSLFPVTIAGTWDYPVKCWLQWYEWRYRKDSMSPYSIAFERRLDEAAVVYKTEAMMAGF